MTIDHVVPFQCSTNVVPVENVSYESPTALQLVVLAHDTPLRSSLNEPLGLGLVMIDQLVPFQCSTNVCAMLCGIVLSWYLPTA